MRPGKAIEKLQELKAEATDPENLKRTGDGGEGWKSRVRAVVARSLGNGHDLVKKLDDNSYSLSAWSDRTPDSAWTRAFAGGVKRAVGYVDAAIYELQLIDRDEEPLDDRAFDVELWEHVKGLVEAEDWSKIPSQVSIFVEDQLRTWAGPDAGSYGKGLYANVLGDSSELRLGGTRAEWEGWRSLGVGFVGAVGNANRHRRQTRSDARRYAIGVLGIGSLLLTQVRHEHEELIMEREAMILHSGSK